jgi:hypothetical protein
MTVRGRAGIAPIAAVIIAMVLAGCGSNANPSPGQDAPSATADAVPTPAGASPTASPTASVSAVPSAKASPGASPAVPIDPTLLAILPVTVGGQGISEVPEVEANLMTDPSLVANANGLAVALGIDINSGEFAYVAVIRLKPLVFSNAFYLSWRQSYDAGACSQSSGLTSTSTTTIAGRQVFVGTCAGGASTYHVHLAGPDRLLSITSVGTSHYGELVLATLKP